MLHLGAGSIRLDMLLRALPSAYSNQGLNLPNFALAPIRDTGLGFYTYLYRYLYQGGAEPVIVGRMEEMREEPVPMLSRWRIRRAKTCAHSSLRNCRATPPAWGLHLTHSDALQKLLPNAMRKSSSGMVIASAVTAFQRSAISRCQVDATPGRTRSIKGAFCATVCVGRRLSVARRRERRRDARAKRGIHIDADKSRTGARSQPAARR